MNNTPRENIDSLRNNYKKLRVHGFNYREAMQYRFYSDKRIDQLLVDKHIDQLLVDKINKLPKYTVYGLRGFTDKQLDEIASYLNNDTFVLQIKCKKFFTVSNGNYGSYTFKYVVDEDLITIRRSFAFTPLFLEKNVSTLPDPELPPLYKRGRDKQQYMGFTLDEWMYINLWVRWFKNDYKQGDEGYERKFDFPEIVRNILIAKAKELVDGGLL